MTSTIAALVERWRERFVSREFLYRKSGAAVIVILMLAGGLVSRGAAQERPQLKRPNDTNEEKPVESKKTKKVKGPRAVGLLQLSDGKATLIPVAILVDGKFYDASVYKADPVPMALDGGTVYEGEQSGESQGLFTTNGALHSQSATSATPWMGTGAYLLNGTEAAKSARKAENVPVGIDSNGDEPPRLTRKSASGSDSTPAAAGGSGTGSPEKSGGAPGAKGSSGSESSGGDAKKGTASPTGQEQGSKKESPSAEKPSSEQGGAPAGQPASGAGAESSSGQPSSGQPTSGQSAPSQSSSGEIGGGKALGQGETQGKEAENYYRPALRRGKPTQPAPEEEATGKVVNTGSTTAVTPVVETKPVQVMAAVSDAGGPAPVSYQFFWKEGEEEDRRKQMLNLAGEEVLAYINARAKGAIGVKSAAPARTGVPSRKKATQQTQPVFEEVHFKAFDIWKNNQPVMILSAEAHLPAERGAASAPETYSVTLVSRTDIYGSLRKLYSGVTDKFHLDVTPRLDLIDAVDADGDGRGELLFRQTTDAGKGYVIYRATGDKLLKMFDNLGAE